MEFSNLTTKEKVAVNQIKLKNIYKKLKNDYFLRKVFNNLERRRTLNIIKHNKNIQKRLNINKNDYEEYSEKYSLIEIEIKPHNNKFDKFINIDEKNKNYYHIYFNNNKEEINRNCINKDEQIETIEIKIDYQIESFESLFENCYCIKSIYFKKFNRTNIINMSYMFRGSSPIKN